MSSSSPVYNILSRLTNVSQVGPGQWSARCPAHEDGRNSLSITTGSDGKAVLFCHAHCDTVAVLRAVNGTWSDIFPSRVADPPMQSSSSSSSSGGKGPRGKIVATYDYHDAAGKLLFQVVRFDPKDFRQRSPTPGGGWTWSTKGIDLVLYRLPQILAATPAATIFLVEGEKDADNLIRRGLIATTIPGGAAKWKPQYADLLHGRHVVIIPDIDDPAKHPGKTPEQFPGWQNVVAAGNALLGVAASVRVLELPNDFTPPLAPKWDVTDWLDRGGTKAQFDAAVAAAKPWARQEPASVAVKPGEANEHDDDPHRLARAFLAAEYTQGDDLLLRFWKETFYRRRGGAYGEVSPKEVRAELARFIKREVDRLNAIAVKNHTAKDDEPPPFATKVTTQLVGNVFQALQGECLISGDFTMPTWLDSRSDKPLEFISLQNGILNIEEFTSGRETDLIPHTPAWFSTCCLPFAFDVTAECPRWLAFLDRNLEGDQNRIDLLQEWFGYNLTPDTSFQKFLVMEGEGANGKSVVIAALTAMLGEDNVSNVPLELFGEKHQLTGTLGKLANISGDVGDLDKAAEGFLKSFTSGDRMQFDRKFKSAIYATPTARMTMAMNNRPRFSDRSDGLWRRMILLPMRVKIDKSERVLGMDKSDWWERSGELSGMFCWALVGLHRLRQQNGFTESDICDAAIEEYKSESNPARAFLTDALEADPNGDVVTSDVYDAYKKWCDASGHRPMARNMLGKEIVRVFTTARGQKVKRNFYFGESTVPKQLNGYVGIRIKPNSEVAITDGVDF